MRQAQRQHPADMLIDEAIIDHAPVLAHRHNALAAQDTQLMRDSCVVAPQAGSEVADAQLSARSRQKRVQYLQACRIGKNREKLSQVCGLFGWQERSVARQAPGLDARCAAGIHLLEEHSWLCSRIHSKAFYDFSIDCCTGMQLSVYTISYRSQSSKPDLIHSK